MIVLAAGICSVAAALLVWASRADTLLAGHPAYPVLVTVVGLLGLVVAAKAWRASGLPTSPTTPTRRSRIVRRLGVGLLVALAAASLWLRPYPVDPGAVADPNVTVTHTPTTITLTSARGTRTNVGLIFQPGARVDPRAYVPLLSRIAAHGHLVVIVKQPFNVGFLAKAAPNTIRSAHPEVARWVVGGHSLGGVVAASDAAEHSYAVSALLLWASYPADSLADQAGLAVTSISGTADTFTTPAKVDASRSQLPPGSKFTSVEGGIHSFFGDYGLQPGDGSPTTSRAAAQQQIVADSLALMGDVSD